MSDAENSLDRFIGPSETVIGAIEIFAAYLLVGLFVNAAAFSLLLLVLVVAYYVVQKTEFEGV